VLEASPLETRPKVCDIFPDCGGCLYQTLSIEAQMEMKKTQIEDALGKVAIGGYEFEGILANPKEFEYRNKMEFSFGDDRKDGPLTLGLHKRASTYDVLSARDCKLVHPDVTKVLTCVEEYFIKRNVGYYRKMQHIGYLRHLLIRRGEKTGELLVNLVTTTQEEYDLSSLIEELMELEQELEGEIVGVLHILNDSLSDVVKCDELRVLHGRDYINEKLLGLFFKITPFSFFQPNTLGAEIIYQKVREYLGDVRENVVYDLFSGTGTISQVIAPMAKKVIGVELVEEAVLAARENADRNGLENCDFIVGDVFTVLDEIEEKPDVIILDPPRDGIHPKALPKILSYEVERIVYISCKITSFARDLEVIQEAGYRLERCVAIDQFSQTGHVEVVALLSKQKSPGSL
jgi:23S rRNA (uracil-5-)-methyltransferase RumA